MTPRQTVADRRLERLPPPGEQVIAGIAATLVRLLLGRRSRGIGRDDGETGDVDLRARRTARELFDGAAVEITRLEVHGAEVAAGGQDPVDEARAFEQVLPIDVGDHPHAGDDVADSDVGRPLATMHFAHCGIGRRPVGRQSCVEPAQSRSDPWILIAQAVNELDHERARSHRFFVGGEHFRRRPGSAFADAEQAVGQCVRAPTRRTIGDGLFRQTPKILDEHDPQCDRHRPQFADRQRLHLLVGVDIANQHVGVEATVGMGDECPGETEDAGIARERTRGELGKLPVETRRQIGPDLSDPTLDQMVVVDEPFGGGGDGFGLFERLYGGAIGREQSRCIVTKPMRELVASRRISFDCLRRRQAARMIFQAFDSKQLFANGCRAVPGRRRHAGSEQAMNESCQLNLSSASLHSMRPGTADDHAHTEGRRR